MANRLCADRWRYEGTFVSAILVLTSEGPSFIGCVMTLPEYKNSGLARLVTTASLESLADDGHNIVVLYITDGNRPSELPFLPRPDRVDLSTLQSKVESLLRHTQSLHFDVRVTTSEEPSMAPVHDADTHYTNVEVLVGKDTVGNADADLWQSTVSDTRPREWGGLLHADFNAVENLGIDLSIRLSDGRTGQFFVEEITDETHVTIRGAGPAPF
jgi:hypothetical protein